MLVMANLIVFTIIGLSNPGRSIVGEITRMTRIMALVLGIITILLGGLWLLQGLGIVQMRPILCFADCAPVQGPSLTWAIVGAAALAVGGFGVVWSRKRAAGSTWPTRPGSR